MQAGQTLTVRGEGGAVFELDVPEDGTAQRELLDDAIANGRLKVLSGGDEPEVDGMPSVSAKVDVWRAYAVEQGMDPDEVAKTSKKDLVAVFTAEDEPEVDESEAPAGEGGEG